MSEINFSSPAVEYSQTLENNYFKNDEHSTVIFNKFHEFYQTKKFVDIDLIVGPNTFRFQAHRVVLSASSKYFFDAFARNSTIGYLEVQEVDEVVMERILGFMYTSSIALELHSVEAIFRAGVLFKMSLLIETCSTFMENNINLANCLALAGLALEYDRPGLLKKSLAVAHDNFEEIRHGTEFFEMTPELLRELLSSDFLRVDSEEVVLQSLVDWANFDENNRHKLLPDLLSVVRFELLNLLFITKTRGSMRNIPKCDDVIFSWVTSHIECQEQKIVPKIRPRNMNYNYSILCGKTSEDWNIMKYNGVLDSWSRSVLPNCSRKRTYFKAIVTEDNCIIISGGHINEDNTTSVECLNMQNGTWSALPCMQEARLGHVMVMLNGSLFVMGGFNNDQSSPVQSVEKYNFQTRSWRKIGMLPYSIQYGYRHAIVNDQLYIIDVYRPKMLKCFDSLSFGWTRYEFDHDVETGFDMVAIGDELYLCLEESNVKSIERFNPAENKWTVLQSDGIERFSKPRMFAFSNKLIFWGKASDVSGRILVEMYDPDNGNFTPLSPLTELLYDLNLK